MMRLLIALMFAIVAAPAFAQQVDIRTTPPGSEERPGDFVVPGPYYDRTEPRENEWYPYPPGVRVPYDPAFIEPASRDYETPETRGRVGIAGWTSQNIPVGPSGSGFNEQSGWFSLGFAITWGAPPRPPARPAAAPQRPAPAPSR